MTSSSVASLSSKSASHKESYAEFHGLGSPIGKRNELGQPGDIYIDIKPGSTMLYAKVSRFEWKKWPGPLVRIGCLRHPRSGNYILWCSAGVGAEVGWFPQTAIKLNFEGTHEENVARVLQDRAARNRQPDPAKKAKRKKTTQGTSPTARRPSKKQKISNSTEHDATPQFPQPSTKSQFNLSSEQPTPLSNPLTDLRPISHHGSIQRLQEQTSLSDGSAGHEGDGPQRSLPNRDPNGLQSLHGVLTSTLGPADTIAQRVSPPLVRDRLLPEEVQVPSSMTSSHSTAHVNRRCGALSGPSSDENPPSVLKTFGPVDINMGQQSSPSISNGMPLESLPNTCSPQCVIHAHRESGELIDAPSDKNALENLPIAIIIGDAPEDETSRSNAGVSDVGAKLSEDNGLPVERASELQLEVLGAQLEVACPVGPPSLSISFETHCIDATAPVSQTYTPDSISPSISPGSRPPENALTLVEPPPQALHPTVTIQDTRLAHQDQGGVARNGSTGETPCAPSLSARVTVWSPTAEIMEPERTVQVAGVAYGPGRHVPDADATAGCIAAASGAETIRMDAHIKEGVNVKEEPEDTDTHASVDAHNERAVPLGRQLIFPSGVIVKTDVEVPEQNTSLSLAGDNASA
ncbi:unnamed protein product [Cyclocybe aegerita]|uniref:PWWP domain-containing protein n=1 Tax=Cyclocybe aegerita TaxID=1973307 RepID=A0A8S0X6V6_CYCAE|nr:unnamed protein product [Cyclocybe aegerita]